MGNLLLVLMSLAVVVSVVIGISTWATTKSATVRNIIGFCLCATAAYCVGSRKPGSVSDKENEENEEEKQEKEKKEEARRAVSKARVARVRLGIITVTVPDNGSYSLNWLLHKSAK